MPNHRRGFTVVEAVVVSGLLAVLALMLSSVWVGVGKTTVSLIRRSSLVQERDMAVAALSHDLGGSLGQSTSSRLGGKQTGRWLDWSNPVNADEPLNTDLRLLYDGGGGPALWTAPNTTIRYLLESGNLVRWDETANTRFIVATSVSSMKVAGITGRPNAFKIELVFTYDIDNPAYNGVTLTCNITAELP